MFKPGQSGNPLGGRVKGRRYHELYDQLAADFGGASQLSGLQAVALQAVRLLIRAEKPRLKVEDTVKLTNAASRLLVGVARKTMDPRVLLEHAGPLPDPRPVLGHAVEDATGLIEATAGEHQLGDTLAVFAPLLDLVEVAPVSIDRIVSLFV